MNSLVQQFVAEARDYLDEAARGLLALEQSANDAALINGIFRNFHTIKGTSGIFPEFLAITRLTHVAEDLMDQVRNGQRTLDTIAVDALLGVLDQLGIWLECIDASECLPSDALQASQGQREYLGSLIKSSVAAPETPEIVPIPAAEPPGHQHPELVAWIREKAAMLPPELLSLDPPPIALSYRPDESCFFMGEDPINLIRQLTSPLCLELLLPDPLPALDSWDPFTCQLTFRLITVEQPERLQRVFGYVQEQLVTLPITAELLEEPAPAALIDLQITEESSVVPQVVEALKTVIPEEQKTAVAADHKKGAATAFIRVDQRLVNQFMDLVGELLVARNSLPYLSQRAATVYNVPALAGELDNKANTIGLIVESLQDMALEMRMLPVAKAFERFPRLVRDLSNKLGKKIQLVMEGEETRADKDVIEALSEPLVHMVRNSLDHGIEMPEERLAAGKSVEGTITLRSYQDSGSIVVEIIDDGKGIDPNKIREKAAEKGIAAPETLAAMSDHEVIQLVFAPNFSTADTISDLSGRGVGMDAVQTMVNTFGGSVQVTSALGSGSTVLLTLPLSMAITRILTIRQHGCTFGIPADAVLESLGDLPLDRITTLGASPGLEVRGDLVPLYHLGRQLEMEHTDTWFPERFSAVVVKVRGEVIALAVEEFCDIIDAVVKPTSGMLARSPFYSGTTIMGDGSIMLLLNLVKVVSYAAP